ncbi:Phosphoglycerate kinase [Candidatus Hepatoplasma crinochetorum Av]|uniref:Phosphoglycerate kinase n=1 Tax=Candidatus Hepatoplasma crinochetorum Av TaxID=1427984 RepID=W8GN90_9MOLU|nr:phosphoglycerate kinase [Candidatus Hepatoplasma crinochetorum]AHK22481.1 Phosphoglycerate kinase [Candidatus Hepatoplasma crinochetorum Av]
MRKKTLHDLKDLKGKIVLVRVDFNVPIENGKVTNNARIVAALPTIEYLIKNEAKVILLSHLGRIKTEEDKKTKSLKSVAMEFTKASTHAINFVAATRGKKVEEAINNMENGSIMMIENTRFEDVKNNILVNYESKNDEKLGKYWASLGDLFVNDAFGTAHRAHASNVGIAKYIKESAIGFLIEKEIKFLHDAISEPKRPFIALLGGAKVSDKINVIDALAKKADKVIIGTAMCYTFHLAMGKKIGKSLAEPEKVDLAKKLMKKYQDKLVIASDSICTKEYKDVKGKVYENIPDDLMGLDIGPKTIKVIKKELKGAKTVIWNGPFGVTEFKNYQEGSKAIAHELINLKDAITIIGGGDSAAMAIKMGIEGKISHISTGGGASMEFLEGKELPGIAAINNIN